MAVMNVATRQMSRRRFLAVGGAGAVALTGFLLDGCSTPDGIVSNTTFSEDVGQLGYSASAEPQQDQPEEDLLGQRIEALLQGMSLEHKVAQMFITRPEDVVDVGVVIQAGDQTKAALSARPLGGIIYFGQNLTDSEQTSQMLANTMQFALDANGIPPFLCVDEEGGSVSRIGGTSGFGAANVGDMADIGAQDDPALAKQTATTIAGYLKPLGFNVDFAPVCDVANNPDSNTMRERSFGADPQLVARMAAAQVEGFLQAGMLCSAKHFPGIGAAVGDSHDEGITTGASLEALRATELVPFAAAIKAGVPFVMVGHISVPAVVGGNTPASLAPAVVQGLLREELGYQGLIITDSLGMGAVSSNYGVAEASLLALKAGCDIMLMPPDLDVAYNGVVAAVNSGEVAVERIDDSVRRVLRTKLEAFGELFG